MGAEPWALNKEAHASTKLRSQREWSACSFWVDLALQSLGLYYPSKRAMASLAVIIPTTESLLYMKRTYFGVVAATEYEPTGREFKALPAVLGSSPRTPSLRPTIPMPRYHT